MNSTNQNRRCHICTILIGLVVVLLAPVRLSAQPALPNVLDTVPENSAAVVVVPQLQELSDSLAALNSTLGLDVDTLADPLGTLLTMLAIPEGIRADGSAALVVTGLEPLMTGNPLGAILIFVPITDFESFLGNFDAIAGPTVEINIQGVPAFARSFAEHAVVGFDQLSVEALVETPPSSIASAITGYNAVVAGDTQISLTINVQAIQPIVSPLIALARTQIEETAATSGSVTNMDFGIAFAGVAMDMWDSFLRDTAYASLGARLDGDRIHLVNAADFIEGSTWASVFPSGDSVVGLLSQLPNQPSWAAWAVNLNGFDFSPIREALNAAIPEGNPITDMWRQSFSLIDPVSSFSCAFYSTDDEVTFTDSVSLFEVDGPAFATAYQNMVVSLNGITIPTGLVDEDGGTDVDSLTYVTSYTPNASALGDYRVDHYSIATELPAEGEDPSLAAMADLLNTFGANSEGLIAIASDHVIATTQPDEALLIATIEQRSTGGGLGSATAFEACRSHLYSNDPFFEGFIDFDRLLQVFADMFVGLTPSVSIPHVVGSETPVAFFAWTQGSQHAFEVQIPTTTINNVRVLIELLSAEAYSEEPWVDTVENPEIAQAGLEIRQLESQVEMFIERYGYRPAILQQLEQDFGDGPIVDSIPVDPWGNAYYLAPVVNEPLGFFIYSYGPDGQAGTGDEVFAAPL